MVHNYCKLIHFHIVAQTKLLLYILLIMKNSTCNKIKKHIYNIRIMLCNVYVVTKVSDEMK